LEESVLPQIDFEDDPWKFLHIFANSVRIDIIKQLSQLEMATLSDIANRLGNQGLKMSLPGLLKHMGILEDAGIVRAESGGVVLDLPDARKTVYFLAGRERVDKILKQLENNICNYIAAGETFNRAHKLARKIDTLGRKLSLEERKYFESLIIKCESTKVYDLLTEDEKKKVKSWRMNL
jgi:DNA-binding transcriptional ArsR family regulator